MFNDRSVAQSSAFRALYDETFSMLFHIACRVTSSEEAAEDIVHDSYIKLVERWAMFPSKDDMKYWLIRVVKNSALNYVKRKGREKKVYERYFKETEKNVSPSPESDYIKDEDSENVKRCLNLLPEKLRMVLILKEYGLLNYKEIGKVLGISEGNVKVRVFRAREALLALMREEK